MAEKIKDEKNLVKDKKEDSKEPVKKTKEEDKEEIKTKKEEISEETNLEEIITTPQKPKKNLTISLEESPSENLENSLKEVSLTKKEDEEKKEKLYTVNNNYTNSNNYSNNNERYSNNRVLKVDNLNESINRSVNHQFKNLGMVKPLGYPEEKEMDERKYETISLSDELRNREEANDHRRYRSRKSI